ncbi:hypothetical protein K504DRAFT_456125 [Pleomassaria siparia CBS 279.74]|uniref:Myb-like domain-containing protein n=1 Tax=Pleomassaria siparia CBS 279.74 TaxID=1314801 RepID=A0A6G1K6R4_9PLEO|nr:hypothetical protein K504DRAFT_456125 [Pleomassaria siparia CBS 279.74]
MLHHQPQILSPLVESHAQAATQSIRNNNRKMSAGGNRSWSEEEEHYLLQTRQQKMPYKHIAAHLKKTELACRLHFHQLSHGSHRRKRTSSVSSSISCSSAGNSPAYSMSVDHDDYSQSSRHGSPLSYNGSPHMRTSSASASPNTHQHKILLPKPRPMTPRDSPEPHNALRINTEVAHQPKIVDTDRLRSIYEARRQQFWSTIAAEYGADVSPAQLEEIWRTGHNAVHPPTPEASPDGSIMYNPALKPSHFPYAQPAHHNNPSKYYSPITAVGSVSSPDRLPYMLPMPVPSVQRQRAGTWSSAPRDNVPIASLLTEDKNPRSL